MTIIPRTLIDNMIADQKVRVSITKESHWYFFHFYFAHYVKYQTAPFQREMFELTENEALGNFFIVAFRGSGKSTILTTSYPIWAILGKPQKKFVLILCQTIIQAKQHLRNLRQELENNKILKNDLGPFKEESDEWGSLSLVFSNLGARITVASSEQSIRGLRHHQHRPDLIIGDDIEDIASTKTRDGRNKTYQWLTGEVIPTGDRSTRLVIIGNLLHEDSLLMRLKREVTEQRLNAVFKEYPLVNGDNQILWPGKYPTLADIENERKTLGNENAWQREYMLKILSTEDQIIHRDWLHYYDVIPSREKLGAIHIGVDLAISERATADYTALVTGWLYRDSNKKTYVVYIDPIMVNRRMDFPKTVETCEVLHKTFISIKRPLFAIEDVGYQRSLPQLLEQRGLRTRAVSFGSQDKRSRLSIVSHRIKSGEILFPQKGCEELISQLVDFGIEKHDDLADAFTTLIIDIIDHPPVTPNVHFILTYPNRPHIEGFDERQWRTL